MNKMLTRSTVHHFKIAAITNRFLSSSVSYMVFRPETRMGMPRTSITSKQALRLPVIVSITIVQSSLFSKFRTLTSPMMFHIPFSAFPPPRSASSILSTSPRRTYIVVYLNPSESHRFMLLQSSIDCFSRWGRLRLWQVTCLNWLRRRFSAMEEILKLSRWNVHSSSSLCIGKPLRLSLNKPPVSR